jgi:hypothetical protein
MARKTGPAGFRRAGPGTVRYKLVNAGMPFRDGYRKAAEKLR